MTFLLSRQAHPSMVSAILYWLWISSLVRGNVCGRTNGLSSCSCPTSLNGVLWPGSISQINPLLPEVAFSQDVGVCYRPPDWSQWELWCYCSAGWKSEVKVSSGRTPSQASRGKSFPTFFNIGWFPASIGFIMLIFATDSDGLGDGFSHPYHQQSGAEAQKFVVILGYSLRPAWDIWGPVFRK